MGEYPKKHIRLLEDQVYRGVIWECEQRIHNQTPEGEEGNVRTNRERKRIDSVKDFDFVATWYGLS